MTNAEKYKEVFGFELNTKTDYYCPFNSTKCDNLPCDATDNGGFLTLYYTKK